jgi:Flp pilus assembly pilin Flp
MKTTFSIFKDDSGATAIEYGVVVALALVTAFIWHTQFG